LRREDRAHFGLILPPSPERGGRLAPTGRERGGVIRWRETLPPPRRADARSTLPRFAEEGECCNAQAFSLSPHAGRGRSCTLSPSFLSLVLQKQAAEPMSSDAPLKLLARDAEDLSVLSVHLQDAALKIADIVFLPREHRFAFAVDRFDWERRTLENKNCRRRTAVHFDGVTKVSSKGVPVDNRTAQINLL